MNNTTKYIETILEVNKNLISNFYTHLRTISPDFLKKHLILNDCLSNNRQDPPRQYYYSEALFDSYANKFIGKKSNGGYVRDSICILNTEHEDEYLSRFIDSLGASGKSVDEAHDIALNNLQNIDTLYQKNEHISYFIGTHLILKYLCKASFNENEKKQIEEAFIKELCLYNLINRNTIREFNVNLNDINIVAEITSFEDYSVKLKKEPTLFGNLTNYNRNSQNTICKTFVIPKTIECYGVKWNVNSVEKSFFDDFINLESVEIPEEVESVEWGFWNCKKLKSINVKESEHVNRKSIRLMSIDGVLFRLNRHEMHGMQQPLEMIAYPNAKDSRYILPINYSDKYGIRYNVVSIAKYAFKDCNNIKEIHLPGTVKKIGINAFYRCYNLTDIFFEGPENALVSEGLIGESGEISPTWHFIYKTSRKIEGCCLNVSQKMDS